MNALTLPDIAAQASRQSLLLDWVGMCGIAVPVILDDQRVSAIADAGVSLDNAEARGIHMSRLYLALELLELGDLGPALLRRVWQELLDNAWRHARSHVSPRIEVSYEAVPGGHAYFVHDNGLGFEPEKAAELFGLFQRAQGGPAPGLGVGLAMVRRIVECHGGRVWATARPGQGASFGFSLPADAG